MPDVTEEAGVTVVPYFLVVKVRAPGHPPPATPDLAQVTHAPGCQR